MIEQTDDKISKRVKHDLISKHKSYYILKTKNEIFLFVSFFIAINFVFFHFLLSSYFNFLCYYCCLFVFILSHSLSLFFDSLRLCFAMYVHLHYHHFKKKHKPTYNSLWTKQNCLLFYLKNNSHNKEENQLYKNNGLYLLLIWSIAILKNNKKIL